MNRAYLLYGQVGNEFGAVSLQVHQVLRLALAADAAAGLKGRSVRVPIPSPSRQNAKHSAAQDAVHHAIP